MVGGRSTYKLKSWDPPGCTASQSLIPHAGHTRHKLHAWTYMFTYIPASLSLPSINQSIKEALLVLGEACSLVPYLDSQS